MDSRAMLGVTLGLVTAFFIGLFMVPRRYFKGDTVTFLVGMTFGAAAGNVLYWCVAGRPFEVSWEAAFALVPGINWAVGTFAYAYGTTRVGLAKATGIKNTQVVVSTAGGFLFFNEAATTLAGAAFLGAGLVVATALVLSNIEHRKESVPHASIGGYLIIIVASVLYGVNSILIKLLLGWGVPKAQMNLGIGLGALVGGVAVYGIVKRRFDFVRAAGAREHLLAMAGGLVWAAGLVTMIISIDMVGVAVAWALLNLSIVVSVFYGVVVFKEVDLRRRWLQVTAGLGLACLGVWSLYLSKALAAGGGG